MCKKSVCLYSSCSYNTDNSLCSQSTFQHPTQASIDAALRVVHSDTVAAAPVGRMNLPKGGRHPPLCPHIQEDLIPTIRATSLTVTLARVDRRSVDVPHIRSMATAALNTTAVADAVGGRPSLPLLAGPVGTVARRSGCSHRCSRNSSPSRHSPHPTPAIPHSRPSSGDRSGLDCLPHVERGTGQLDAPICQHGLSQCLRSHLVCKA